VSPKSQDENYITALGLQKDPFSPVPDSLFYYSFDSFEQRLKVLKGLVQGTDLFVLVIGEPGSGKTTLLNRYLASIDTEWNSAMIRQDPGTVPDPSAVSPENGEYPAYILQDSANPVVIVDDAHQLPKKELEFLIHEAMVPGSKNKIKRLVLFGESNLFTAVTTLAAKLTVQTAINKIYLPGLTEAQTADYLQHRLAISGYSGEIPFNSSEIKNIHQTSGGYPGQINDIARQWLSKKYSGKKEGQKMLQKLSATPRSMIAWFAAAIIIILLAAFWLFSDRKPSIPKPADQKLTKTVFRKKIVQAPKLADRTVSPKIAAVTPPVKPAAEIKAPQTPEAKTPPKPPPPIQTDPPQKEKTLTPQPKISAPLQKDSQLPTRQQPAAKPAPRTPAPVIAKTAAREVHREKWLLSQDPAVYTVQIIGVSNEKSLLEFIKKHDLLKQSEMAYYKSSFKGKPWYQLLYGIYPTSQAARLAANNLPENIRQAGPWIRRLSAVQKAIGN
jgi:DamX protein